MTSSLASPPRVVRPPDGMRCPHQPRCPDARAPDRTAARAVTVHPEQGWSLLCNGVVLFEDAGVLLPEGRAVTQAAGAPRKSDRTGHRPSATPRQTARSGSAAGSRLQPRCSSARS